MEVIREELVAIKEQYNDLRRTEITANTSDINIEDLINQEDVVVTLSHQGYVKYQPLSDYEAQRRGGKVNLLHVSKKKTLLIACSLPIPTIPSCASPAVAVSIG